MGQVDARTAIKDLLRRQREPVKASEIVASIIADPRVPSPAATISSVLTTEAKKDDGLWVRVSRVRYPDVRGIGKSSGVGT